MKTLKVGKFPGMINEFAVESNSTVGEVLEMADLDSTGYEIQLDGNVVDTSAVVGEANLLVLAKQVKGA